MRIISGIHKGRKISAPKKLPVRPTTDMAKESLFNILRNSYIFGQVSVLDLFAGTGNISFEFASRGSGSITAVDKTSGCVRFIAETAAQLDMPINTIKADVFELLKQHREKYDIIFADPPYDLDVEQFKSLITLVFDHGLLNDGGTLIIEHSKNMKLDSHHAHQETRNYGGSAFSFYGLT